MPQPEVSTVHIYFKSILISLAVTCGVGFIQMRLILGVTDLKVSFLAAPFLIGLIFGILAARIILLNHKLQWYSIVDPLTQTFNHGYYKRILDEWCKNKSAFSVILFDIDNFKEVNDEFGHQVGDQTLVHVCHVVTNTKRIYDIFARHGGEEFILLAPRTDLSEAKDLAERLCSCIAEASMPSGKKLTCSFGVAQFRADRDTPGLLFDRTDKALYESKKKGKNRVTLESPALEATG